MRTSSATMWPEMREPSAYETEYEHSLAMHDEQRTYSGRVLQLTFLAVDDASTSKRAPFLWWPQREQPLHGIAMSAEPVSARHTSGAGAQVFFSGTWQARARTDDQIE